MRISCFPVGFTKILRLCGGLATAAVVLLLPAAALAQIVPSAVAAVSDGRSSQVRHAAAFCEDDLRFESMLGYDTVRLEDGECLHEPGKPMLPTRTVRIALPAGMAVTDVRVASAESVELPGRYTIFPAQPPRRVSEPAGEADFVAPDPATYASPEPYPERLVEFLHQTDLAGQGIAVVRLYPVRYAPAAGELTLYTSIEIVLEGVGGYECGDYLPAGVSESGRDMYQRLVSGMVVNPTDVELRVSSGLVSRTRTLTPGAFDYVVITQSSWVSYFQPLADWKTKRGTPTTVVTTSWIYNEGGYSGSEQQKIRAFIQDAASNWGTRYVLLGGDTDVVPYHTRSVQGEAIPNDTYYADLDDDWTCEVHVGRAAVRTTSAIDTFVDKVLIYEKNPPMSDYATTATLLGFDLYTLGSGEGEACKQDIETYSLPAGWTCRTEYDSEAGGHRSDAIGYLNQGNNLVNHVDHSSTNVMGVGYTNHGSVFYKSDMTALSNGNRQSIWYSIGCWPCDFPYTTCIGEAFVQNPSGGGAAFVGNSRSGWYSPYSAHGYSLRYDRYFFRSLFNLGYYTLGECFSDHKNEAYSGDGLSQYIFTELTLLGDPQLQIWTADPQSLTVAHGDTVSVSRATTFTVGVSAGGGPVVGATVCLWKDGDVYEVEQTDETGTAAFELAAAATGTLHVTATAHDYLPYEGQAQVVDTCVGDLDGDGFRNATDFTMFAAAYGSQVGDPEYNPAADLDADGFVNATDLTILAGYLGQPCP